MKNKIVSVKTTASTTILEQLFDLLNQLDSAQFSASLPVLNGSSIGQHVRHVIEFYQCLMSGIEHGVIDYDARQRNLELETSLAFSLDTLKAIIETIESLENPSQPLLLAVSYQPDKQEFIDTTLIREMVYMIEHSIHHYALIRIGIQENFSELEIPKYFGVAYSTIQHQEKNEVSCSFENH